MEELVLVIIFSCLKNDFINYVDKGIISNKVYDAYKEKMGKKTKLNQIKAWANSLPVMKDLIIDLPDNIGITIEYGIPSFNKRIDFVISGYDECHKPVLLLLELKQWEYASSVKGEDAIVRTKINGKDKNSLHPAYQVLSYASILKNYNLYIENDIVTVVPFVYLHNYDLDINDPLFDKKYKVYYQKALMFGKNDGLELKRIIESYISFGDNLDVIHNVEQSGCKPTKKLQDVICNMIHSKKEFILIDEEKIVMERIIRVAKLAFSENKKIVMIVKGGPGTGKSVVALNTLGELLNLGLMGAYVSKNMAPRKVYKNMLINDTNEIEINELFKSSSSFFKEKADKYDFLLVDEAHRLQEKSGLHNNLGENQIKEIINVARISVFFVDEKQMITLKDIGNILNIKYFAKEAAAEIYEEELKSQFRCNGSGDYLDFVEKFLYNKRGKTKFDFDFKVVDSPLILSDLIKEKNTNNNARLVAGFCWTRDAKKADDQNYHDIKIGDFLMSWNLKHGEAFAIRKNAINEVGCVHNVQGLEFDYIGVIIGPDLKYRNGLVVTDYKMRANTEKSLYGLHVLMKKDKIFYENLADTIIRNTYRVLLTRGIKGCYVYACDPALQKHLKKICNYTHL